MNMKKFLIGTSIIGMLFTGVASAATQQVSSVTLPQNSSSAKGNYINGTAPGTYGKLTGALNISGGAIEVSARKVIPNWPDSTIDSMRVTNTSINTRTGLSLRPYESLFYVQITQAGGSSKAYGRGSVFNYGG